MENELEGWKVCPGKAQNGPSNFPRRKIKRKLKVGRLEGWKVWFSTPSAPPPLRTRSSEAISP